MKESSMEFRTEALARLGKVSDAALREMCELVDDCMVIAHQHDEKEVSAYLTATLIDLVLEEERRNSCVQSCS